MYTMVISSTSSTPDYFFFEQLHKAVLECVRKEKAKEKQVKKKLYKMKMSCINRQNVKVPPTPSSQNKETKSFS